MVRCRGVDLFRCFEKRNLCVYVSPSLKWRYSVLIVGKPLAAPSTVLRHTKHRKKWSTPREHRNTTHTQSGQKEKHHPNRKSTKTEIRLGWEGQSGQFTFRTYYKTSRGTDFVSNMCMDHLPETMRNVLMKRESKF